MNDNVDSELAELLPEEERLLYFVDTLGMPVRKAAALAGVASPYRILEKPNVILARKSVKSALIERTKITIEVITQGILDAIDQAKLLADPQAQIAGWKELARLHGYDSPKRVDMKLTVDGQATVTQIRTLSDAALLQMMEETEDAIDADFYKLPKPQ